MPKFECVNKGCTRAGGGPSAMRGLCRACYDTDYIRSQFPNRSEGLKVPEVEYEMKHGSLCWNKHCSRKISAQFTNFGLCAKCYSLQSRRGALDSLREMTIEDRLYALQVVRGEDECYDWLGSTDMEGYPRLSGGGVWGVKAHRLSLSIKLDRPLEDWEVTRHTCDNPTCTNPRHLLPGSPKDNHNDMVARGRAPWQKKAGDVSE